MNARDQRDNGVRAGDKEPMEEDGDVAEHPGSTEVPQEHADEFADEWGRESFPASDPPAHY